MRTLKTDYDQVGVLIYGMGGWGKSSIASRLWDRLPEHEKILWWRQIDEPSLIKKFKDKLIKPQTRELITDLEDYQLDLKSRFAYLFSQLAELGEKPFLLILDDFEWNLEPREGRYILKSEVATILEALVEAIQETGTENRIIITCRYDFDFELLEFFFLQGLEPLRKAELTKKLNRLEHFSSDKISEDIRNRALNLADGNPRLLEFLNNEILGKKDAEAKLTELEESPELWKDQIIWSELYQLIDEPLQQILRYCLVYKLRLPMEVLEAVCDFLPDYQQQLQRGLNLGLIEMSPEVKEENRVYRVSRILPHIISAIKLSESPTVYSLYRKAHEKLHELWGNKENKSEEKWQELFRLLFSNKDNPQRFRQGFSQMLEVQYALAERALDLSFVTNDDIYNHQASHALDLEICKCRSELSEENLCCQLEYCLQQEKWRDADEETAWIYYLVRIKERYKADDERFQSFYSQTFNEIDRLWMNYSNGQFGISVQKYIWEILEKVYSEEDNNHYTNLFERFFERMGWSHIESYIRMSFTKESAKGSLPLLYLMAVGTDRGLPGYLPWIGLERVDDDDWTFWRLNRSAHNFFSSIKT